jgi:hypothetical protein
VIVSGRGVVIVQLRVKPNSERVSEFLLRPVTSQPKHHDSRTQSSIHAFSRKFARRAVAVNKQWAAE